VEILASSKIPAEYLGTFWNSFLLSNYDWNLKSNLKEEEKKEVEDTRTLRTTKLVDSFEVSHEVDLAGDKQYARHQTMARATVFARNISNVRANPCDPDYMEQ